MFEKQPIDGSATQANTILSCSRAGQFIYSRLFAFEGAYGAVRGCARWLLNVSNEFPVFEVDEDQVLPAVLDAYFKIPEVWPLLAGKQSGHQRPPTATSSRRVPGVRVSSAAAGSAGEAARPKAADHGAAGRADGARGRRARAVCGSSGISGRGRVALTSAAASRLRTPSERSLGRRADGQVCIRAVRGLDRRPRTAARSSSRAGGLALGLNETATKRGLGDLPSRHRLAGAAQDLDCCVAQGHSASAYPAPRCQCGHQTSSQLVTLPAC